MNTRIILLIGFIVLIIVSAWLGIFFYGGQQQKSLSQKWDEHFDSFEQFEQRFPKQSANPPALELEKLSAEIGINLTPRIFRKRVQIEEHKQKLVENVSKDLPNVLESRLNHESSEKIEMPSELQQYLIDNEQALEQIVSQTILKEPPVWEVDIQKYSRSPIPNLLGHTRLQKLLNLNASLLIEKSRIDEAQECLEASWKINEHLLKRPDTMSYLVGLSILRLQAGNLRQVPNIHERWHDRLNNSQIGVHLWTILQGEVWIMLKQAEIGEMLRTEEQDKRTIFQGVISPFVYLMVLDWAEVMLPIVTELKMRDPCLPKKPMKIGTEKKLFASWNRIGPVMFHDPALEWNRAMRLSFDLELTDQIMETYKKLEKGSLGDEVSVVSELCKGQGWNYKKTTDGFVLSFSKKIDWSVGEFAETAIFLPDKYSNGTEKRNN